MKTIKQLLIISITLLTTVAHAEDLNVFADRIKHTCSCAYCDINNINLQQFKPGSENASENNFVNSPDHSMEAGWLICNFQGAKMQSANLADSNFTIALRGYLSPIKESNFNHTKLSKANLENAILYGAKFEVADLSHANLQKATLSLAHFHQANLSGANLTQAIAKIDAMHGWQADFTNVDFSTADLTDAQLGGDFQNANFSQANLTNAKLVNSMEDEKFEKNPALAWKNVDFTGANLTGAVIQSYNQPEQHADLTEAKFCHTIMPDGNENNRDC